MPENFWDGQANQVKGGDLRKQFDELLAFKGAEDSKRLTLPKSPEEYKVALTPDFKPPAGVEFKINEADPALAGLKAWAHKNGLSQTQLSEALDVYAGSVIGQRAQQKAAYEAEVAKLGTAGPARIDALTMWMQGVLGDKAAALAGSKDKGGGVFWTAQIVEAFEALQQKFVSQGAGGYSANGRDVSAGNGVIPGWDKMSFEQKRQAQESRARPAR